ncbi:hypothetical protein [Spirillospora albida]|uniref:hypothetical protein n=1 Tax=Spirillospora albida TaxID=58123 RepID=UPI0012F8EE26|nr:hypothetical protein [Spirillospora albida]
MTIVPGLVRRAAAEAERQLRGGAGLLARLARELDRPARIGARLVWLETAVRAQDAELRALRGELGSLVAQLNERLLPRVDERIDDAERDLTVLATGLIRTGRDTAAHGTRLDAAERRLASLRTKLAQLEQRTGLWRDLQATIARLDGDVDVLRDRIPVRPLGAPIAADQDEPAPEPLAGP